jgi:hypothetical protein
MFGLKGFDVVIGNPPYINIEKIQPSEREQYLRLYGENGKLGKRYDLYQLFIMKGIESLSISGILSYILPNTFLVGSSYAILRRRLCAETSISHLVDLPQGVFESATVDNVLLFTEKPKRKSNSMRVSKLNSDSELIRISTSSWDDEFQLNQDELIEDEAFKINVHINPRLKVLFKKMESISVPLGEITESSQGIILYKTASEAKASQYTSDHQHPGWKKLLRGKNIGYYCIKWGGEYVDYGDWLWCQRDEKFFNQPKILLHAMRNKALKRRLVATYDEDEHYNAHNLANIIAKPNSGYDLRYVLALFNSSLINFWYRNHFPNVNINPGDFRQIPICSAAEEDQAPLIRLVDQITAIKKEDPSADTSVLEAQLDRKVCELYTITEEDIVLVEE